MIAVLDYGMGNLFSVLSALSALGAEARIVREPVELEQAQGIILPGVGAFGDAMAEITGRGLDSALRREVARGKPLLGICLGMQLLFREGLESGLQKGLGLLEGRVEPLRGYVPDGLKIPQTGWNALKFRQLDHPMLRHLRPGSFVYFVHSFHAVHSPDVVASCEYGKEIAACVAKGTVWGTQFHPEKSGQAGLSILKAFCEVSK